MVELSLSTLSTHAQGIIWSLIFVTTCYIIVSFPTHLNRWTSISLLLTAGYGAFKTSLDLSPDDTLNEIYARYIIIGGSHILHMAYKNKGEDGGLQEMDHKDAQPDWSPWYRGWKLLFNIRGVGTPWENPYLWPNIKYTWEADKGAGRASASPPSDKHPKSPKSTPSAGNGSNTPRLFRSGRWAGVAIRVFHFAIYFILLACVYEFMTIENIFGFEPTDSDYTREKEGIVRRFILPSFLRSSNHTPVTKREVQLRIFIALEYVVGDVLMLSLYHDFCSILWLSVGLDESWEYPPFFGQITKAYTMRRFWSMFWHRVIYRSFNAHAALISRYVLRLRQRTPVSRVINGLLVFGISAVMHSLVSQKMGNKCAWGRSMLYWMWQPVAFVLEDSVQAVWGRMRGKVVGVVGIKGVKVLEGIVGYAWVCSWLIWEGPKRQFALMSCST